MAECMCHKSVTGALINFSKHRGQLAENVTHGWRKEKRAIVC